MQEKTKTAISLARRVFAVVLFHYDEDEKSLIWYRAWLMSRQRHYQTRLLVAAGGVLLIMALTFAPQPPLLEARMIGSCLALVGLVRAVQFAYRAHWYWGRVQMLEKTAPNFWKAFFELIGDIEQEVQEGDPEIRIEVAIHDGDLK